MNVNLVLQRIKKVFLHLIKVVIAIYFSLKPHSFRFLVLIFSFISFCISLYTITSGKWASSVRILRTVDGETLFYYPFPEDEAAFS